MATSWCTFLRAAGRQSGCNQRPAVILSRCAVSLSVKGRLKAYAGKLRLQRERWRRSPSALLWTRLVPSLVRFVAQLTSATMLTAGHPTTFNIMATVVSRDSASRDFESVSSAVHVSHTPQTVFGLASRPCALCLSRKFSFKEVAASARFVLVSRPHAKRSDLIWKHVYMQKACSACQAGTLTGRCLVVDLSCSQSFTHSSTYMA